jgi:hypothetical protein
MKFDQAYNMLEVGLNLVSGWVSRDDFLLEPMTTIVKIMGITPKYIILVEFNIL